MYLLSSHRVQNLLLLAGSYLFYGAWDARFLLLIFASTCIDYLAGIGVANSQTPSIRRCYLWFSICGNLGILGFFKYFGFFVSSFQQLANGLGFSVSMPLWEIVLPVGISFYTFQTMSYTIDIYRGDYKPTRNFVDFALFVSFFPQLVAGPIERASRLLPQIQNKRTVTLDHVYEGVYLFLWGLFLKVYVADNMSNIVDPIFAPGNKPDGASILSGLYAFSFYAYGDFAGYSSMARGLAKCLGIELMVNFNLPYLGGSPVEFWRRWHVSMSTWLRDYVYIALGGNRKGEAAAYRNLITTMLVSGVWHGAGWNYIIWGLYQGVLLAIHRFLRPYLEKIRPVARQGRIIYHVSSVIIVFHLMLIGWPAFLCGSLAEAVFVFKSLFGWETLAKLHEHQSDWLAILTIVGPLMVFDTVCYIKNDLLYFYRSHWVIRALFYYYIIICLAFFGEYGGSEYFYFQF